MNLAGKSKDYMDFCFNDNYVEPTQITSQLNKQYNENLKILSIVLNSKFKSLTYLTIKLVPYTFVYSDNFIISLNMFLINLFSSISNNQEIINMNSLEIETNFDIDFNILNSNNFNTNDLLFSINLNNCIIKRFSLRGKVSPFEFMKSRKPNNYTKEDNDQFNLHKKNNLTRKLFY